MNMLEELYGYDEKEETKNTIPSGIDWSKFDWVNYFKLVRSLEELQGLQYNWIKADWAERALAENFSEGQLRYVGDKTKESSGVDYKGTDGLRYEVKTRKDLIQGIKTPTTKEIILKNSYTIDKPFEQTFDFMIAVDTTQNAVLLADWKTCMKGRSDTVKGTKIKVRLDTRDCEFIIRRVQTFSAPGYKKYMDECRKGWVNHIIKMERPSNDWAGMNWRA